MDSFTGRLYAFVPCHLKTGSGPGAFESRLDQAGTPGEIDRFYLDEVGRRIAEEVSERSRKTFVRGYLGSFLFSFHGENERDANCVRKQGRAYYTLHGGSRLCVLTIVFSVAGEPVTQLLDRVSREDLEIADGDDRGSGFYDYLDASWGLGVVGKARVCLSSGRPIEERLKPSIFAGEMHQSGVMESAALLPGFGGGGWSRDLAIYDSSQIYSSKTVTLRFDGSLDGPESLDGSAEERLQAHCRALRRDMMLTFIMEVLMFREASIKRANMRVGACIQEDRLSLAAINELMGDFKSAILFWDLDIFLYPTAQQLADTLNSRFDIDRALETYHKNQGFLEQRVNLSGAIEAEKETRTINYIAIIVFFFEATRLLFVVARPLVAGEPIPTELIYSSGLAFSGSVLLFLLIVLLVNIRRSRAKAGGRHG